MVTAFDFDLLAARIHEETEAAAVGACTDTRSADIHFASGEHATGTHRPS